VIEEVHLARYSSQVFEAFLDCIGSRNAGYLRDITVTFPGVERGPERRFRIAEGIRWLQRLKGECTGLVRIELLVYGPGTGDFVQADLEVDGSIGEVLSKVDAQLKGVHSLEKIVLRASSGSVSPSVRELVQRLGWVVH
jgi:hypothetical protein